MTDWKQEFKDGYEEFKTKGQFNFKKMIIAVNNYEKENPELSLEDLAKYFEVRPELIKVGKQLFHNIKMKNSNNI